MQCRNKIHRFILFPKAIEHIRVGGIRQDFLLSTDYLKLQESQETEMTIGMPIHSILSKHSSSGFR